MRAAPALKISKFKINKSFNKQNLLCDKDQN